MEYARKIKADAKVINAIVYGRLKLIARWAKLNPAMPPEETGRGKKKTCTGDVQVFHRNTESAYRKVGDHEHKIDEYQEHQAEKKPDDEMSVAGFIRFATGTEKAGTAAHGRRGFSGN